MADMPDRDEVVGEALRSLDDVPEHRPGFWTDLSDRLDDEWTTAPADRAARRPAGFRPVAPSMAPATGRKRAQPGRPARGARGRWLAVAAAVVFLAGGALVATQAGDGTAPSPTPPATAPGPATTTAGPVQSLEGEVVQVSAGEPARQWSFALAADGRFAARSDDGRAGVASTPESGLSVGVLGTGEVFARENAPLGPLGGAGDQSGIAFLRRDLGWAVAALAATGDDRVTTGEHDGRPIWRFDADVPPNPLADGAVDHVEAIVDRASALPLLVRESARGEVVAEQRVEDLKIGAALDESVFVFGVPEPETVDDLGWRRVPAADAPAIDVPAGYELAEVAVHDQPLVTGPEGGNPGTGPVVSYAYRRGVDVLVVTIQPAGDPGNVWDDPLATEGVRLTPQPFDTGGIIRGGVVVDPRTIPHAWAVRAGRVVTVAGAATGDELATALLSVPDVELLGR